MLFFMFLMIFMYNEYSWVLNCYQVCNISRQWFGSWPVDVDTALRCALRIGLNLGGNFEPTNYERSNTSESGHGCHLTPRASKSASWRHIFPFYLDGEWKKRFKFSEILSKLLLTITHELMKLSWCFIPWCEDYMVESKFSCVNTWIR